MKQTIRTQDLRPSSLLSLLQKKPTYCGTTSWVPMRFSISTDCTLLPLPVDTFVSLQDPRVMWRTCKSINQPKNPLQGWHSGWFTSSARALQVQKYNQCHDKVPADKLGRPDPCWNPHAMLILLFRQKWCQFPHIWFIEGNLKVKLPAIWTNGEAKVGRVREEKRRRKKVREEKSEEKEDAGARKGSKVAIHHVFSRGSKSRLAKAAGAEPSGKMRDEKLQAIVARSKFPSQNVRTTFGSWHVEKLHAVVAQSTFPSQECKKLTVSDHFWTFKCRFVWQVPGIRYMVKSWVKRGVFVAFPKTMAGVGHLKRSWKDAWRVAGAVQETCSSEMWTTTTTATKTYKNYVTLDYTTAHNTTPHHTTLQLQHATATATTTLGYTTVHDITLHDTTRHYTKYNYNYNYNSTTLQLQLQLNYTTPHYIQQSWMR